MAKTSPPQMFDNLLEPIKGWFHISALDKDLVPNDLGDLRLIAGRVVSLNAAGKAVPGLAADAMPLFLWQNEADFDVFRDAGGIGGGKMNALVATGSYELQTTEFQSGTYNPNTPLTADAPGGTPTVLDDIGKVKVGAFVTDTILGIVSDGQLTNENGKAVVQFWTYFLPASI